MLGPPKDFSSYVDSTAFEVYEIASFASSVVTTPVYPFLLLLPGRRARLVFCEVLFRLSGLSFKAAVNAIREATRKNFIMASLSLGNFNYCMRSFRSERKK
jgi:hypothetical protein